MIIEKKSERMQKTRSPRKHVAKNTQTTLERRHMPVCEAKNAKIREK